MVGVGVLRPRGSVLTIYLICNLLFKGLATNYADALTGIYEFIAKDYVEDVYRDIVETYIISTIKVLNFPTAY